jgi:hypothetical protein
MTGSADTFSEVLKKSLPGNVAMTEFSEVYSLLGFVTDVVTLGRR